MTGPVAYLNGRFVPFAAAGLPLHDAGFVSGATVVDNARTYGRKLFRWADHLARFRRDCAACYVPLAATDEELTATANELVARNGALLPPDGELQVVTFATPGPLGFYVGESTNGPPTLGMATYPVPERYRRWADEGVVLAVAGSQAMRECDILPPPVKHRSRMMWHVAERRISDPTGPWYKRGAVPVVVSADDRVPDTPIGGIIMVTGDEAHFPPTSGVVLDSITMRVAEELCDRIGIPTNTLRGVYPEQFADESGGFSVPVTELILAGTGCGLVGVREVARGPKQSRTYPVPGPMLTRLRAAFAEEVGRVPARGA